MWDALCADKIIIHTLSIDEFTVVSYRSLRILIGCQHPHHFPTHRLYTMINCHYVPLASHTSLNIKAYSCQVLSDLPSWLSLVDRYHWCLCNRTWYSISTTQGIWEQCSACRHQCLPHVCHTVPLTYVLCLRLMCINTFMHMPFSLEVRAAKEFSWWEWVLSVTNDSSILNFGSAEISLEHCQDYIIIAQIAQTPRPHALQYFVYWRKTFIPAAALLTSALVSSLLCHRIEFF